MRIKFKKCNDCGRPLHKPICDMCRVRSSTFFDDGRAYNEQTMSKIADLIVEALESGMKMSLQLTRARI